MLANLFKDFFGSQECGFNINTNWKENAAADNYLSNFNSSDLDGEIVYEGGGNLCVIYKNEEIYKKVNKALSKRVLSESFGISVIASCTQVTGNFVKDREKLYKENAFQKNLGAYYTPCNVLPFTQTPRQGRRCPQACRVFLYLFYRGNCKA